MTINIMPNWEGSVGMLVLLIEKGDAKGRATAIAELTKMGKLADLYVASQKKPEPVDPVENIGSVPLKMRL